MARLDRNVRKRIELIFPPQKCTARAKSTQRQHCQRYAMVGSSVCVVHGGKSPQAKAKAAERIALAEAALDFGAVEPRHPGEALIQAVHVADMMMRNAVLPTGLPYTEKERDDIKQAIDRVVRYSKVLLDAGIDERRAKLSEMQAGQVLGFVRRVCSALGLTPAQEAILPSVLEREVSALITPPKALVAA